MQTLIAGFSVVDAVVSAAIALVEDAACEQKIRFLRQGNRGMVAGILHLALCQHKVQIDIDDNFGALTTWRCDHFSSNTDWLTM